MSAPTTLLRLNLLGARVTAAFNLARYVEAARDLEEAVVRLKHSKIHAEDEERCETGEARLDRLQRDVQLVGPLDEEQQARLLEIADRCPIHRTLNAGVRIETTLANGG